MNSTDDNSFQFNPEKVMSEYKMQSNKKNMKIHALFFPSLKNKEEKRVYLRIQLR